MEVAEREKGPKPISFDFTGEFRELFHCDLPTAAQLFT